MDETSETKGGRWAHVRRLFGIRESEGALLLLACLFFFCLMSGYYILRPLRDAMGIAGGVRNLQWLFSGTLVVMILANPAFAALVARMPRQRFIPIVYRFFLANLALFFLGLHLLPEESVVWLARAYYVWVSVFNLFVVSIFWSFMADIFRSADAKRLFGLIGIGGTIGAMTGSSLTALLSELIGPINLIPISILLLEGAVRCAQRLHRIVSQRDDRELRARESVDGAPDGGGILDGMRLAFSSPYLAGICLFMFLYSSTSTVLYFELGSLIESRYGADTAAIAALWARMDLAVNSMVLVIQAFFTGRIVAALGVGLTLVLLPGLTALGFSLLGVTPLLGIAVAFYVFRRTVQFAVGKPTREILYTPLDRDEKYKAKNFIDTFVYRGGDALAAWGFRGLTGLELGLAPIAVLAVPIAVVWAGLGYLLGRRQSALAGDAGR